MPEFDFVAIDFETASVELRSACAVGIVAVKDLRPVEQFFSYIQPPRNYYNPNNTQLHGIGPNLTADAPIFAELWPQIDKYFDPHVPVVAHNAQFDMSVLRMSAGMELPDFVYVDTITLVSRIVDCKHGLLDCAEALGIDLSTYDHHSAKDDAHLCGRIAALCLLRCGCVNMWEFLALSAYGPYKWFSDLKPTKSMPGSRPKKPQPEKKAPLELDPAEISTDGPLAGKGIVFTGELCIERSEAEAIAAKAGAIVKAGVSKKISFLVVGQQLYTGGGKSGKEKKAEELNASGEASIQVLTEQEFFALVSPSAD